MILNGITHRERAIWRAVACAWIAALFLVLGCDQAPVATDPSDLCPAALASTFATDGHVCEGSMIESLYTDASGASRIVPQCLCQIEGGTNPTFHLVTGCFWDRGPGYLTTLCECVAVCAP